jgi:hypothetical protein
MSLRLSTLLYAALAWIEPPTKVRTFRFRLSHICRTAPERDRPAALSAHSGIHAHGAAEGGAADCPAFSNVEENVL